MSLPRRQGITYSVPSEVLSDTQGLLRDAGFAGREGYVVWVGDLDARGGHVRAVWPVSSQTSHADARASYRDVLALSDQLQEREWFILAQIHSHPRSAFHSSIDDAHPISHQPGFISIVVPDFGAGAPGGGWRVHEYLGSGRFRLLDSEEANRRMFGKVSWWKRLTSAMGERRSSSRR